MKKRASVMQRIGFVVFPDFEVLSLDTATVFEVANVVARKEPYELHVLSDSGGQVRTSIGVAAQQRIFRRRSRGADPDGLRGPRPPQNLRAMSRPCRSTPTLFLRDSWPTRATGPNPNASCSCTSWCSIGTAHSTSPAEISEAVQPLRARLATLEAENAELRAAVQDETKHAGSPNARTRRLT